jgi:hypothetical protein
MEKSMMKNANTFQQNEVSLYNDVSIYSVVVFKEHGHVGNEVKGVVTSINGDEITVEDFNDQVWTMDVNNASISNIFSGDKVK